MRSWTIKSPQHTVACKSFFNKKSYRSPLQPIFPGIARGSFSLLTYIKIFNQTISDMCPVALAFQTVPTPQLSFLPLYFPFSFLLLGSVQCTQKMHTVFVIHPSFHLSKYTFRNYSLLTSPTFIIIIIILFHHHGFSDICSCLKMKSMDIFVCLHIYV